MKVAVVAPTKKKLVRRTEQPGQIEAYEVAPLSSRVSGFVCQLHVDVGSSVRGPKHDAQGKVVEGGQVLVELDVPELLDERREKVAMQGMAKAELAQADAAVQVAEAKRASTAAMILEATAQLAGATATVAKHKAELDRTQQLAQSGTVTQKLVDEATSQFQAAEAARSAAEAHVAAANAAAREAEASVFKAKADVQAAEAQVGVRTAELQRAATMVGFAEIRAPFDGVVSARHVHTGHLVQAGATATPLLVVSRNDKLRLSVEIPEVDAVHVQVNHEVKLRIPSLPNETLTAAVARTEWSLHDGSRTLRCEVDLDNRDGKLRPGMYLYADVLIAEHAEALTIPRTAVMLQGTQAVCFVVDGSNKIIKQPITIGLRVGSDVEILSGLSGSEQIIAANVSSLREGQDVEIAK